jgi:hypothetical protein
MDEESPLNRSRRWVAVVALGVFLLSFTAVPIRILEN